MKLQCLIRAFRLSGRPVLFLSTLCLSLGLFFTLIGSAVGLALITAGVAALILFSLLGASWGCVPGSRPRNR